MEKYENLGLVGEGSYGLVMKCRHRESGQIVAIKKFIENEDDLTVKKIALREVRMLKKLRHENLVNLIEVFRRRRRLYLVFEFVDHTILDELEQHPNGLEEERVRQHIWQILRGLNFCHSQNIIHRDIKPENVLVSRLGVIKLCDFGFARILADSGENYTDYVATRWYRAPELLVGETKYGKEIDIWALGCLFAEMLTGDPLFPGESDVDQVFYITSFLGPLSTKHQELLIKNPMFSGMKMKTEEEAMTPQKLSNTPSLAAEFIKLCLQLNPAERPPCNQLLNHKYFNWDRFPEKFLLELKQKIQQEFRSNPLLKKYMRYNPMLSSKKSNVSTTEESWKNRHQKHKYNKEQSTDETRLGQRLLEIDNLVAKSSITSTTNKLQFTPPKIIPTKIPSHMSKVNKVLSPKNEPHSLGGGKEFSNVTTIPPIGYSPEMSNYDPGAFGTTGGLALIGIGNSSSPDSTKHSPWFPEKHKKNIQKKTLNQSATNNQVHNAPSNLMNNLLQGERSQLHDKVLLTKRKSKYEGVSTRSQTATDDFSLPDLPGASGSPNRVLRSQRKTVLAPVMPTLTNFDHSHIFYEASPSPPHNHFNSGFPFM